MNKLKKNSKQFEVTLAKAKADTLDFDNQTYYIQPKLDGVRCYTRWVDGEVKMFSRNHKEFMNCDHLKEQLSFLQYYPELILDGELYNHDFKDNFNKIISIVRKKKPSTEDRIESRMWLQYHTYDVYDQKRPEIPYIERLAILKHLFEYKYRTSTSSVKVTMTKVVKNNRSVHTNHTNNKYLGYEGSILRTNTAYEQRRSAALQKVKDWNDSEFTILGFVEGEGKFSNGLGKFLGEDSEGLSIEVPAPYLTIPERQEVWKNRKSYLGKLATFEWFERTPAGAYRFPRFKGVRDYE